MGADGKGVETLTFERGREGGEVISFKENRTPSLPPELWEGEDSHTRERESHKQPQGSPPRTFWEGPFPPVLSLFQSLKGLGT